MSMRRTCSRVLTGLFVMAALSACDRSVDLSFKAQPGDQRVFHVTRNVKFTGADMMGNSDSQEGTSESTFAYEVTGAGDAGTTAVTVTGALKDLATNDTLAPMIEMGMEEGMSMMADQAIPMGENPFADVDEVELSLEIDPSGALTSVTGMDEVGEKLSATIRELSKEQMAAGPEQMAAGPEQMQEMQQMLEMMAPGFMEQMEVVVEKVTWQLRRFMSNQAATTNLRFLTDVLPAQTVEKGSTWTKDSEVFFPPAFLFETFTVTERSDGVCTLKYEADIAPRTGNAIDLSLVKLAFSAEGTKTGTIQVDEETGWIKSATIEIKQDANVSVTLDLSSLGLGDLGAMPGVGDIPDVPISMEGTIHVESGSD